MVCITALRFPASIPSICCLNHRNRSIRWLCKPVWVNDGHFVVSILRKMSPIDSRPRALPLGVWNFKFGRAVLLWGSFSCLAGSHLESQKNWLHRKSLIFQDLSYEWYNEKIGSSVLLLEKCRKNLNWTKKFLRSRPFSTLSTSWCWDHPFSL